MSLPVFPQFPSMAWNSEKAQSWEVTVKKSGTGKRKTMTSQAYPNWTIKCSYTALSQEEVERAAGFFAQVKGELLPFLWKDPEDYQEPNVRIGTGNGANKEFQLLRNYADEYVEPIYDVVPGTLMAFVDGVTANYTLGTDGLITMAAPPALGAVVTATFEYYWRVAFDVDNVTFTNFWYNYYELKTITLVNVR